jgi:uncharacterized membrane protein YedE/YeeE
MEDVPVLAALGGGMLIGLAATVLLLLNGRIAGISGILGGAFTGPGADRGGRIIMAGLLVGFGSRLGSGCTSGHGVCGIARLSTRSIVATVVFTAVGMVTVAMLRLATGVM